MRTDTLKGSLCLLLMIIANPFSTVSAEELLYRQPVVPHPTEADRAMSCVDLDREIQALTHLTYRYKPGFFEDPYQSPFWLAGAAFGGEAFIVPVYSTLTEITERQRIYRAQNRIETLRLAKAEKHCYSAW